MTGRPIVVLTDFGTADPYVGALKGVLVSGAPEARVFDLSHDVSPGDVAAGAFLLGAVASHWPAGTIFVAVVDPGVGSDRRLLGLRDQGRVWLAPDNGLLERVLCAGAELRAIERPDLYLAAGSATFHGRDRLAPIAAWIARGGDFSALGPLVEDPVRLHAAPPRRDHDGGAVGHVVWVDRFGNVVTDIPAAWLPAGGAELRVREHRVRHRASHYAAMQPDLPTAIVGSLGTVEISLRGAPLAAAWRVAVGDAVRVVPAARGT